MPSPKSRLGDIAVPAGNHVLWPPTSFNQGCASVFVNGAPATTMTHTYAVHCLGNSCHAPIQETGSGTVFLEGNGSARIGDKTDCGMLVGTGSSDVFTGD